MVRMRMRSDWLVGWEEKEDIVVVVVMKKN